MALIESKVIFPDDLWGYYPDNRPEPKNMDEQMREMDLYVEYQTRPIIEHYRKWREKSVRK